MNKGLMFLGCWIALVSNPFFMATGDFIIQGVFMSGITIFLFGLTTHTQKDLHSKEEQSSKTMSRSEASQDVEIAQKTLGDVSGFSEKVITEQKFPILETSSLKKETQEVIA